MPRKRRQNIKGFFIESVPGRWDLNLYVKDVEPQPNADFSRYTMIDIEKVMNMEVSCHGVKRKPRVILKVYCKLDPVSRKKVARARALISARNNSPMLH